jgi:hypothetical protein
MYSVRGTLAAEVAVIDRPAVSEKSAVRGSTRVITHTELLRTIARTGGTVSRLDVSPETGRLNEIGFTVTASDLDEVITAINRYTGGLVDLPQLPIKWLAPSVRVKVTLRLV